MGNRDIEPFDFFKRYFVRDMCRGLEEMQREMQRMYVQINDINSNLPKELVREYETKEGDKRREIGPIVYGYSMNIGPDGKTHVREFGNVKSLGKDTYNDIREYYRKPQISAKREPLSDVTTTEKEVKVVLEMPGIKKEDIKINAYYATVEVIANSSQRKYHKAIELPKEADNETAISVYNNGILEITFDKKERNKTKRQRDKDRLNRSLA